MRAEQLMRTGEVAQPPWSPLSAFFT
jgi:hypothetical protein